MKSTELRIGNLLQFKSTQYVAVVELIHNKHVGCRSEEGVFMPNVDTEPIPLTEEWLLKFGFEKAEVSGSVDTWYNHSIAINTYSNKPNGVYWLRWYSHPKQIRIEYVNQLQNLYFALTGEELNLNK